MAIYGHGFLIPENEISKRTCGGLHLAKAAADHHGNPRRHPTAVNKGRGKTWNKTVVKIFDAKLSTKMLFKMISALLEFRFRFHCRMSFFFSIRGTSPWKIE